MDLFKNLLLNTDSYKYSQPYQYPPGTELVYSYIESRGGKWDETVFFGLQMFLKEYMSKPITKEDIDVAEEIVTAHGEPFYRELWEYILKVHNGWLPVVIKAVPEGTVVPTKNVLVTIEPTDRKCWWLSSFLETALLRAVWFPTTVCTNSYVSKRIILEYLHKTGNPGLIDFKLHDFGSRGVSSYESAGIGGAAHLVNFKGTDTVAALLYARKYYDAKMAGFSIPAMEHSTVTSWGRENEVEAYRNMLNLFGKPGAVLAAVSDSYNIYDACSKLWGTELKEEVINSGATVVIRPDCLDSNSQILTPSGWKFFTELTDQDLVAQVKEDQTYEFVKPLEIINQPYEGEMYQFRDFHGKVDLLVTPNHRMVYFNSKKGIQIKEASEYKQNNYRYKKIRAAKSQTNGKQLTWHERFLIALQADGCIKKVNSSSIIIEFNFQKQRKHDRLLTILNHLEYEYKIYYLNSRGGQSTFCIRIPVTQNEVISKTFNWVDISNLDSLWCEQFIEELKHWDSSIRDGGRFKYDTTVKENIDMVEYIAISAGKGILISKSEDKRKECFSDVYTAHILDDPFAGGESISKTKVMYNGTVHCVKVPTGMILVKRNRCVMVTGNSGHPPQVVTECLQILDEHFGHTINDKGYKVLNNVSVIQGDGINQATIDRILYRATTAGFSADNITFGQGGGLLQQVDRDTLKFAMKCSAARVNGEWRDVYKQPITDFGKESKKGRVTLYETENGFVTDVEGALEYPIALQTVYKNGQLHNLVDFETVRSRATI